MHTPMNKTVMLLKLQGVFSFPTQPIYTSFTAGKPAIFCHRTMNVPGFGLADLPRHLHHTPPCLEWVWQSLRFIMWMVDDGWPTFVLPFLTANLEQSQHPPAKASNLRALLWSQVFPQVLEPVTETKIGEVRVELSPEKSGRSLGICMIVYDVDWFCDIILVLHFCFYSRLLCSL